jgi:hypothetical protein
MEVAMLKQTERKTPKGGYSIRGFAREADLPEGRVRAAVRNKEIEVVEFGGVKRIPPRMLEKVEELYK